MIKTPKTSALPRFYIKPLEEGAKSLLIAEEEAHHLQRVLRLKTGDLLAAFDGRGNSYKAQITAVLKDKIQARILETRRQEGESTLSLHLVQALLRAEKMEWVVQKATELGVSRLTPLITARSLVKLEVKNTASKHQRWQKIAQEAAKQCGRSSLPVIEPPRLWEQWLQGPFPEYGRFFFYEREKKKKLKVLAHKMRGIHSVLMILGPEGGWEPQEVETLQARGFISLSLGPRILRAETAALAAITLMQHLFGDLA